MSAAKTNTDVLTTDEKISKAKIQFFKKHPFFSYLIEHMDIMEDNKKMLSCPSMGVNGRGKCFYNKEFVDGLSSTELLGVLAHETIHVAMEHVRRGVGKAILVNGQSLWNIAIDIVDNQMLVESKFELPQGALIPNNNQIDVFDYPIVNISEKSAEDIYEELRVILKKMVAEGKATEESYSDGSEDGDGGTGEGFSTDKKVPQPMDNHLKDADGEDESGGKSNKTEGENSPSKDWKKILAEAISYGKMAGNIPAGMERHFEETHRSKINWRALLRRVVASKIPYDLTYTRPNKKFINQEIFMPSFVGESVKVICGIDTSGSIGDEELNSFIAEMIGIARSFSQVDFWIICHDAAAYEPIPIYNGNMNKLRNIKIEGGGGTDHRPLFDLIKEKRLKRETKLLVSFTDGESRFPDERPEVETIFVLGGSHVPPENMPEWATTVCID